MIAPSTAAMIPLMVITTTSSMRLTPRLRHRQPAFDPESDRDRGRRMSVVIRPIYADDDTAAGRHRDRHLRAHGVAAGEGDVIQRLGGHLNIHRVTRQRRDGSAVLVARRTVRETVVVHHV